MHFRGTHHIAVYTDNFDEMAEFYTERLGFPVTQRWDEVGIIFIDVGSTRIELIPQKSERAAARPRVLGEGVGFNHLALHVADVDQTCRELQERGIAIIKEPADFQTIRIAFFNDPDGNVLELVQELHTR